MRKLFLLSGLQKVYDCEYQSQLLHFTTFSKRSSLIVGQWRCYSGVFSALTHALLLEEQPIPKRNSLMPFFHMLQIDEQQDGRSKYFRTTSAVS